MAEQLRRNLYHETVTSVARSPDSRLSIVKKFQIEIWELSKNQIAWTKCPDVDKSRLSDWKYCEARVVQLLMEAEEQAEFKEYGQTTWFRIIEFKWMGLGYDQVCIRYTGDTN